MNIKDQNKQLEPTKSELEILQVLWKHGPSTVRLVNDTLNEMNRAEAIQPHHELYDDFVSEGRVQRQLTYVPLWIPFAISAMT